MSVNLRNLRSLLDKAGIRLDTYSPGDGVCRYRFFGPCTCEESRGACGANPDYFGGCNKLHTSMGFKAAMEYANGAYDGYAIGKGSQ